MTEILPTIIIAALFAMIGVVIGFHIGYATRNPKKGGHVCSGSYMPAPPLQDAKPACTQYALVVCLKSGVYDTFAWDAVEKVYTNQQDGILVVRLRNGEEHTYTDARKYKVFPVTSVEDVMRWEEYKKENKEEE